MGPLRAGAGAGAASRTRRVGAEASKAAVAGRRIVRGMDSSRATAGAGGAGAAGV